jgi:hypothetical protein
MNELSVDVFGEAAQMISAALQEGRRESLREPTHHGPLLWNLEYCTRQARDSFELLVLAEKGEGAWLDFGPDLAMVE